MDAGTLDLQPRAYLGPVRKLMLEPALRRAVVLLGPRRVGKTILIRHLIADLVSQGIPATRIAYVEKVPATCSSMRCSRKKIGKSISSR